MNFERSRDGLVDEMWSISLGEVEEECFAVLSELAALPAQMDDCG